MNNEQREKRRVVIEEMVTMLKDRLGPDTKFLIAVSSIGDGEFSFLASDAETAQQFEKHLPLFNLSVRLGFK